MSDITDKHGKKIEVGDLVYTPFRGGRHEGEVEYIVKTAEEAQKIEGITPKHPPKIVFHDQNDKLVSHNPGTLENLTKD